MTSATLLVSVRCSQQWPAVPAETGTLMKIKNTKCDVVSWVGFRDGQKTLVEKTANKVCTSVSRNVPYWFLSPDKYNIIMEDVKKKKKKKERKMLTLGKQGEGSTVLN